VPNAAGDEILRSILEGHGPDGGLSTQRFLSRIPDTRPRSYGGRTGTLSIERIAELWFHLTDRCNMACSHCLFASSPGDGRELPLDRVLAIGAEAYGIGCRLFALTGGEPLVHPHIERIVRELLGHEGAHVAMLTNALVLRPFLERLAPDPAFFHLQISLDGLSVHHDRIRGKGAFETLLPTLQWLKREGRPYTLSMCVNDANVHEMPDVIDFAASVGARNVHYMWYFVRGRGKKSGFVPVETLFEELVRSADRAERLGISIDNLEALKTQVFAPAGTLHDGGTAGWESLAVGPDERLYPSAALVGVTELASDMPAGLVDAWRESPVLSRIRESSAGELASPLRFLLGGGDLDHSYLHSGAFLGGDPYEALYERTALWLIGREAALQEPGPGPGLRLQMGEILESCGAHGKVALVHSNCLLAAAQADTLTPIKTFYSEALAEEKPDILNPVCYDAALISHIPERFRFRGYGCGSPILDAHLQAGERVVDLGCGSGVECFIASRLTGRSGRVIGIDMLDPMLERAREGRGPVTDRLGYDTLDFRKGYLEALPVESGSVDVVISNCVMNLSAHKRKAYGEIFRILRPGGRLVISDVVCEEEPDPALRNDETLRGECIAGALSIPHLVGILEESGFESVMLQKRFPYRQIRGHAFFSLTYSAVKPAPMEPVSVIYRGPLPYIVTTGGRLIPKGTLTTLDRNDAALLGDQVFILDEAGKVLNMQAENPCACHQAPANGKIFGIAPSPPEGGKHRAGCMVCGAPLVYARHREERRCAYCGMAFSADGACRNGHYVCDRCHAEDALAVIRHICLHTAETDMIRLLETIRRHPAIPVHGPEHHALVPGIILAVYRNLGGEIDEELIEAGISRGSGIAGGFCGFMGVCGAAVGVGIAFSLLMDANPVKPTERRHVQGATQAVLKEIAALDAARCCQRDCWIALVKAAELSETLLPIALKADHRLICAQQHLNRECLGKACQCWGT
jgi:MoaA/NifB/PqqE/SkfB family radical SAM enzyme/SAM-dependent methyltransferase